MSLVKEYRARLCVSRISTGRLVRFVALSVRFIVKVAQSTSRYRRDARGACGASGRIAMEEGACMSVQRPVDAVHTRQCRSNSARFDRPVGSLRCQLHRRPAGPQGGQQLLQGSGIAPLQEKKANCLIFSETDGVVERLSCFVVALQ